MRRLIWGGIIVVIVGVAAFSLRPKPVLVDMGNPELRTVSNYIAEEAKTRLRDDYLIDVPLSGTVQRISLEVGDVVEAGDVIAQIDSFDLEQQIRGVEFLIRQSRAQISGVDSGKPKNEDIDTAAVRTREMTDALRIAEKERDITSIDFEQATRDYDRAKRLVAEGVASQSMLDDAERAYKGLNEQVERTRLAVAAARKGLEISELASSRVASSMDDNEYLREVYTAEIQQLEAQLAVMRSDLEKTVIHAPVAGPVLEKYIENTRVLVAGTPILLLGDLSTMEIESDVLSEEVVSVSVGDEVELTGKALTGRPAQGSVARIYPAAFQKISSLGIEQQRVKTIVEFDNEPLQLRAGTRLDVRIITDRSVDATAVPERAVFRREGEWYVFVVEGGAAVLRPVKIGIKNDTWAEVQEGLTAEDLIILEPNNDLVAGQRVAAK
jgi:HlyD family secretion protein